jgi:aromatic ring-cleaving dioxygenase
MTDTSNAAIAVNGYHAHVYHDTATKPTAEQLAEQIGNKFSVKFGGFRDGPVGPHDRVDLQAAAAREDCRGDLITKVFYV